MRAIFLSILLMMSTQILRADNNLWVIYFTSNDSLSDCSIDSVSETTLWFTSHGGPMRMPIDSIARLRFEKRSQAGREAATGLVVGMITGGIFGYTQYRDDPKPDPYIDFGMGTYVSGGILVGAMLGTLTGTGLGVIAAVDPKYDLRQLDRAAKREVIREILRTEFPKPER